MKKNPTLPLIIVSCVALALSACDEKKVVVPDPARDRQLQDLQDKIAELNSRSDELGRQIADRDAADEVAKRRQLEKDQERVEREKSQLEQDRENLANRTEVTRSVKTQETVYSREDEEPVYEGKRADYNLFYTRLENDGEWIESDDYGYIWQPALARNQSWRPYSDGRWVHTDRGWTWVSNERFGWATYHYGRWVNLRSSGWCWVPGSEWAPAWVSWRSGDRYVGWAPLPPEARIQRGGSISARIDVEFGTGPAFYNFVDTQDFGEPTYVGRLVERDRNVTIISQTVNITNITRNNTVINNYGPDYDHIRRRSQRPIARYQLALDRDAQSGSRDRTARIQGNRLEVLAPIFNENNDKKNRPDRIAKRIEKAEREKGWRGLNPEQTQSIKVNMEKREDEKQQRQDAEKIQKRLKKERQEERNNPEVAPTPLQAQPGRNATPPKTQPQATPDQPLRLDSRAPQMPYDPMNPRNRGEQPDQATPTPVPKASPEVTPAPTEIPPNNPPRDSEKKPEELPQRNNEKDQKEARKLERDAEKLKQQTEEKPTQKEPPVEVEKPRPDTAQAERAEQQKSLEATRQQEQDKLNQRAEKERNDKELQLQADAKARAAQLEQEAHLKQQEQQKQAVEVDQSRKEEQKAQRKAQQQAEEEARRSQLEQEAQLKQQEQQKQAVEADQSRKEEQKAQREAQQQAAEESRRNQLNQEAQLKQQEQQRQAAEAEQSRKEEQQAQRQAQRQAEQEAQRQQIEAQQQQNRERQAEANQLAKEAERAQRQALEQQQQQQLRQQAQQAEQNQERAAQQAQRQAEQEARRQQMEARQQAGAEQQRQQPEPVQIQQSSTVVGEPLPESERKQRRKNKKNSDD